MPGTWLLAESARAGTVPPVTSMRSIASKYEARIRCSASRRPCGSAIRADEAEALAAPARLHEPDGPLAEAPRHPQRLDEVPEPPHQIVVLRCPFGARQLPEGGPDVEVEGDE